MLIKGGVRMLVGVRSLHTTRITQAVEKATLSKLRKKTGFPFVNCKKALEKFEGDLTLAEKWLRDEAQKEGWAKATKLQGRPMSQGLIGVVVDNLAAAMVEVNCETDFVARNPKFQSLVSRTAALCLQSSKDSPTSKVFMSKEAVNALQTKEGSTVADLVALEVGNIGENMAVRRAVIFAAQAGEQLGTYVHSAGPHVVKDHRCSMGRYGALVIFNQQSDDTALSTAELGRQLGQHVVGMNPRSVGFIQQPLDNTDTQQHDDSDNTDATPADQDQTSMLHQEFLLEPSLTVSDFLEQNSAEVLDFVRFQCGEELDEE